MEEAQLEFLEELPAKEEAVVEAVADAACLRPAHLGHQDPMDNQEVTDNPAAQETMALPAQLHQAQAKAHLASQNVPLAHPDQAETQDPKDHPEMLVHQDKMFREEAKAHQDPLVPPDPQAAPATMVSPEHQVPQDKFMMDQPPKAHLDQQDQMDHQDHQDQEATTVAQEIQEDKAHPEMLAAPETQEALEETESQEAKENQAARENALTALPHVLPLDINFQSVLHGIPDFSTEFMAFYCIPLLFFKNIYFIEIT